VGGEKLWEAARSRNPSFTCAKLFWWYNMYSTADFAVTPRPMYPADGRKLPDIHTHRLRSRRTAGHVRPVSAVSLLGPGGGHHLDALDWQIGVARVRQSQADAELCTCRTSTTTCNGSGRTIPILRATWRKWTKCAAN